MKGRTVEDRAVFVNCKLCYFKLCPILYLINIYEAWGIIKCFEIVTVYD